MTQLTIYKDDAPEAPILDTEDAAVIQKELNAIGVRFERWKAEQPLAKESSQEDVLAAYATEVARLKQEGGFTTADVLRVTPDFPNKEAVRAKFLNEHTHSEDEVRFFVEGAGAFYLRVNGKVYKTVCAKDDLISVPNGTKHWFDMGPNPDFTAIRFFEQVEGWTPHFTGDEIASKFPKFELA